jgi:hypothetical protein
MAMLFYVMDMEESQDEEGINSPIKGIPMPATAGQYQM